MKSYNSVQTCKVTKFCSWYCAIYTRSSVAARHLTCKTRLLILEYIFGIVRNYFRQLQKWSAKLEVNYVFNWPCFCLLWVITRQCSDAEDVKPVLFRKQKGLNRCSAVICLFVTEPAATEGQTRLHFSAAHGRLLPGSVPAMDGVYVTKSLSHSLCHRVYA